MSALCATAQAQGGGYPMTVVPPGKGPFSFPQGYQTPWEKIEMMVTEKLAPNLFLLSPGARGQDPPNRAAKTDSAPVFRSPSSGSFPRVSGSLAETRKALCLAAPP